MFRFFSLVMSFFVVASSSSVFAYEIPIGRKYPPDFLLQEGNTLMIPPDFDMMLPDPGLYVMTDEERQMYKDEALSILFPHDESENVGDSPSNQQFQSSSD